MQVRITMGHDSRLPQDAGFAATRWSLVAGARGNERAPLAELCARYWYPVYSYIRRAGHPASSAHDLTRKFLGVLLASRLESLRERRPQRFREWLLEELNRFLAGDWQALPEPAGAEPPRPPLPADLYERRHLSEGGEAAGPEAGFQRSFAIEVLERAHQRLRVEAIQAGRERMFDRLERFMTQDPSPGEYEAIAKVLEAPPMALVIAVRRLRQRFRELVDEELVETIADPADLASERTALFAALGATSV